MRINPEFQFVWLQEESAPLSCWSDLKGLKNVTLNSLCMSQQKQLHSVNTAVMMELTYTHTHTDIKQQHRTRKCLSLFMSWVNTPQDKTERSHQDCVGAERHQEKKLLSVRLQHACLSVDAHYYRTRPLHDTPIYCSLIGRLCCGGMYFNLRACR